MNGRRGAAAERFAERRRQEDEAPRLRDVVPELVSCRIELGERRASSTSADVTHTRHLVVDRAPALVLVPCSDPGCRDGGHDISHALLRGLRERRTDIIGDDDCHGSVGTASCGRVLTFHAFAAYATATDATKSTG